MSASREKQKRRELIDSGAETQQSKAKQEKQAGAKKGVIYGIIAAAFIALFIVLLVLNSNGYMERKTAATVGDESVGVVDFDYYYRSQINQYANYFGDSWSSYAAYFTSDTFVSSALSSIQQTYLLCDAAEAEGRTLTEDELAEIDETISNYELYASYYGYGSTDAFIEANFGKGCSADSYRAWMEKQYLASDYATEKLASFTYTDEEIDDYYAENANDFDTVTYRTFYVDGSETDEFSAEDALAQAQEIAESMAAAAEGNEAAFNDLCAQNASSEDIAAYYEEDADYSLIEGAGYSSVADAYADWLFDAARQPGETTAIGVDTGYYVLCFVGRDTPEYDMVNVRHILIGVDDTTDEAAVAEAQAQAEALLAEWEAGDATEDSFAELAVNNSTDTGSASEGGLYENVYKGQMVEAFEDWCFAEGRQAGDTGIVETEYGFHIMYFSGYGDDYLTYTVDDTLRNNDYSAWYEAEAVNYETATVESGLKHCYLTVAESSDETAE